MWKLLWRGRCRCYFNFAAEYPLIWSIDDGVIVNEYKVADIAIQIPGFHTSSRTPDMPHQPKVWFEHEACAVYINEHKQVKIAFK